jgi:hypothetical protein
MTRNARIRKSVAHVLLAALISASFGAFTVANGQSSQHPYQEGRPFGLGVIVGDPTGITAEKWLGHRTAFDFAAEWSLDGDDSVALAGDHLWYDFGITGTRHHAFALHYGLGARALLRDARDDRVGVRLPIGLTYFAGDGRVGIFAQVAPLLDVAPDTDVGVQGGVGARYFLR